MEKTCISFRHSNHFVSGWMETKIPNIAHTGGGGGKYYGLIRQNLCRTGTGTRTDTMQSIGPI